MEIGSSSLPGGGGGAGSSDSSLNGLKFGKKIYFEDVGIGVSAKSGNGSSSSSSISERGGTPILGTTTVRKGRGGVLQGGGKPPRCQVEGCNVDLSNAKAYHSRHKVCGMHSKFPKVIVAGTEQRFCQQCSRFHQLSEFDQGKRSCRRRLAGHNERRRKPQPGSLISSRYGRLSSENGTRIGGFLMDFTTYPRLPRRDAWSTIRAGGWAGHQSTASGRLAPHQWQCITETSAPANVFSQPSHPYLQGSAGGTVFSSSRIPSNECFSGVSDSSCALSLLSNQPWCARNQTSDLLVSSLMNGDGTSMAQSTAPHTVAVTSFTNNTWSFKNNEVSGGSEDMPRDFAIGQGSESISGHFSDELEIAQQGDRQYMELAHSRNYGSSSNQVHWSH